MINKEESPFYRLFQKLKLSEEEQSALIREYGSRKTYVSVYVATQSLKRCLERLENDSRRAEPTV